MKYPFVLLPLIYFASISDVYAQNNPEEIASFYYKGLTTGNLELMKKYAAEDYKIALADGREVKLNFENVGRVMAWEKKNHHRSRFKVIGINGNQVTIVLSELNDYQRLLGLGWLTEVNRVTVEGSKVIKSSNLISVHENCCASDKYKTFKEWFLQNADDTSKNKLMGKSEEIVFTAENAKDITRWLKKWKNKLHTNDLI
jgi:hypothetical protein